MFQTSDLTEIAPGTPPLVPAISPWYQASGGTFFFEGTAPAGGAGIPWQVETDDNNRIWIERSASTVSMRARTTAAANIVNAAAGSWADATLGRFALAIKPDSVRGCFNGGAITAAVPSTTLPSLAKLRIGNNVAASAAWGAGLGRLQYFPYFMSDADLQTITSGRWPFVMPSLSFNWSSTLYGILRLARTMTARMAAEAEGPTLIPFGAVRFAFVGGALNLNTSPYLMTFNGFDFMGVGQAGEITQVEETTEMKSSKIGLKLSGVNPALVSIALGTQYQGTPVSLWIGFLDREHKLLDTPSLVYSGQLDTLDIKTGTEATLLATIESRLADWERARVSRYTDAAQRSQFPSDKGLQYVSKVTDMELDWGN